MWKTKIYTPTDCDPFMFYKLNGDYFILFSVFIENVLTFITKSEMIDNLYADIRHKYDIKRLRPPDKFL